jgi:anti-sigma B factor antagonist
VKEANLQTLGEQLFALVDGLDGSRLELDMEAVDYLTSMALGKFVELYKRVRDRGGRLVLANLTAPVYEIFEVTKLHRLLDIRQAADADNDSEGLIPLAS